MYEQGVVELAIRGPNDLGIDFGARKGSPLEITAIRLG